MKQELLTVVADARGKEGDLEAACVDAPADPSGRWNAKDHLAHAAWWRDRDAQLIDAVRTGSAPPPAVGSREGQEEGRQNAVIYQAYRDRPVAEVRDFAKSSWDRFTSVVEACSEADLSRPHPYAKDEALWQTMTGICYHTGEHLAYWYEEQGDEVRLEETHKWLRDIYVAVAPDATHRANANYNLACFYARKGRADSALPLLRQSLTQSSALMNWAKKDSDLDPIRDDPKVKDLLAS